MKAIDPRVNPALVPEGSKPLVIAKNQKEFLPIPSIITPSKVVITRWELSQEERRRILEGEDIYLSIWGTPIRPVCLSVGPLDWSKE